jgi:hypothetical protein
MAEAIRDDVFIEALPRIILPSRPGKHAETKIRKSQTGEKAKIHFSGNRVYQD